MSKLLLEESPLLIMPKLATLIGLNESIILQQIHYWTEINKKVTRNLRDGFYWTYNSYESWNIQFPFFSRITIKRTILSLEKMGLIVTGNYNQSQVDRTKWYRINYDKLDLLEFPSDQFDPMDGSSRSHGGVKMSQPIPETKPKTISKTSDYTFSKLENSEHTFLRLFNSVFFTTFGFNHRSVSQETIQDVLEWLGSYNWIKPSESECPDMVGLIYDFFQESNDYNKCTLDYFLKAYCKRL
jgi:hypothetical protein